MVERNPETRYARSGDVNIAYQVIGDGPVDLLYVPPFISNLEVGWEWPGYARFLRRLASFSRLILLDKRGTGLSDRVTDAATLEERMDDIRAVMDAAGSERATLYGASEGGPMCIAFAATYPTRVSSLILYGSYPKALQSSDYPQGTPLEAYEVFYDTILSDWGGTAINNVFAPSAAGDPGFAAWMGRFYRQSASPGAGVAIQRMNTGIDVRHLLPAVRVPTRVIFRAGELAAHVEGSRYLAEHIRGATLIELDGVDFFPFVGDQDAILDAVQEFVTGSRPIAEPDRVLTTVLFTDIVGSTERAAALGDHRWKELLDSHHEVVRAELARYRGREVNTTGDGFVATFDGPARAIQCACDLVERVARLGLELRAGLHTGEVELHGDDIAGLAVHIGARVGALAQAGEVLASGSVPPLVAGSGIEFSNLGDRNLKGVPGTWQIYRVDHIAPPR